MIPSKNWVRDTPPEQQPDDSIDQRPASVKAMEETIGSWEDETRTGHRAIQAKRQQFHYLDVQTLSKEGGANRHCVSVGIRRRLHSCYRPKSRIYDGDLCGADPFVSHARSVRPQASAVASGVVAAAHLELTDNHTACYLPILQKCHLISDSSLVPYEKTKIWQRFQ